LSTNQQKQLIAIVGPTAVGKTGLSVKLAQHFKCEILSADSRQFYKEMSIGTAKPTPQEMDGINHHFIGNRSIHENYTAGDFEKEALQKLEQIFKTQNIAILVGGSGLFINALCFGLDDIPSSKLVRNQLMEELESQGFEKLQAELKKVDPIYFDEADHKNPRRVIRALEVFRTSGKPYSTFRSLQKKTRSFKITWIGLNLKREEVYSNINKRVDKMIHNGLIEESKSLEKHKELVCLKTVGYQEFYQNPLNETRAIELIKQNTRRFAKRQITFFKKNKEIIWFEPNKLDEIKKHILSK
jgi:tRNA dimethylallyltransferase